MLNRLAAGALGLALVSTTADARAESKVLDKETFFQMESIANPVHAPDGSQIVFTRGFVDAKKDQNASLFWVTDTKGERLRQLTEGTFRDSSPAFSPDGK